MYFQERSEDLTFLIALETRKGDINTNAEGIKNEMKMKLKKWEENARNNFVPINLKI